MANENLSLTDFLKKASTDTEFLKVYGKNPEKLTQRYTVSGEDLNVIHNLNNYLDALSADSPNEIANIRNSLSALADIALYPDQFGDSFSDRGFRDSFNDSGNFKDVYKDRYADQ